MEPRYLYLAGIRSMHGFEAESLTILVDTLFGSTAEDNVRLTEWRNSLRNWQILTRLNRLSWGTAWCVRGSISHLWCSRDGWTSEYYWSTFLITVLVHMQHVILGLFQNPEGCQEGDAGSWGLAGIKMLCHESLVSSDPTLKKGLLGQLTLTLRSKHLRNFCGVLQAWAQKEEWS